MSRVGAGILVALGGLFLLGAVLWTRRTEPVVPKKRVVRVVHPPAPPAEEPSRAVMTDRITAAEEELLVLCAKRDQLLRTKRELEEAARKEQASADKRALADEHYRLAERYFQAADYSSAALQCQKSVEAHPEHLPARALIQEIQFLLRKSAGR